jgi:alkylated DNA repair dioxygenase AlkB
MLVGQRSLFGSGEPAIDPQLRGLRRIQLDESAWIDHSPGWVDGHQQLLDHLSATTQWKSMRREMYDRMVDVPRLVAMLPEDGPGHPLLAEMTGALAARYGTEFPRVSMALYRDGNDSVAYHGDLVARELPQAIVATVSLGEPRRFLLRPAAGGKTLTLALGWGDLLVMGGSCQRTWRHAVPKVTFAHPRVVVMLRPEWSKLDDTIAPGP